LSAGSEAVERALAESFQILPTFERESRLTLERLDEFRVDAHPLVRELIPVARDLSPTLADVRRLSPSLRNLFIDLDDLNSVSRRGLPALRAVLDGLAPVLDRLDPFLANLNPVLRYLAFHRKNVTDFLGAPGFAHAGVLDADPGEPAPEHALRIISNVSTETLSIWPTRLDTNRGNTYLAPGALSRIAVDGIFPNFDCKNTDYTDGSQDPDEEEVTLGSPEATPAFAPCIIQGPYPDSPLGSFGGERFPQLFADP